MSTTALAIVHDLTQGQPPRVWSLLVTIFGDLAQSQDARISGHLLSRLTEVIGIKPEANRVALHRLRKEGWIVSHRSGRKSEYALTDWGLSQTQEASPRIYATGQAAQSAFLLLSDTPLTEAYAVAPGVYLASAPVENPDVLCTELSPTAQIPAWISTQLCNEQTMHLAKETQAQFAAAQAKLPQSGTLTLLEIAVIRVLVVHAWRRIALRSPILPDFVFPTDWQGPQCRTLAAQLLDQLQKPSLSDLATSTDD